MIENFEVLSVFLSTKKERKKKCFPNKPFWEAGAKKGNWCLRKGLFEALGFINENIWWIIGNSNKLSMWKCNWIPCDESF